MDHPRLPFTLALVVLAAACDSGDGAGADATTTTSATDVGADASSPTAGVWRLLGGDHLGLGTRLRGAARHDGALYVSYQPALDNRVDIVRFAQDGTRTTIDVPHKIQNTQRARLVSSGEDLFLLVPYYAGGDRIAAYRLEGEALVEIGVVSTTARTLTDLVVVRAGMTVAAAWTEGDGAVVVATRDPVTDTWAPVGGGPVATPTLTASELSLDHEDGRWVVAYSENEDQELFATVLTSDGGAWTRLGEPRVDGSLGFFDVALADGDVYFLRSIPAHRILRWDGAAWAVAYEGEPGEHLFDLRSEGGDLYWVAHGGTHGAGHVARMHAGRVAHYPNDVESGGVLIVAPLTTFPTREIVVGDGELHLVYEDITGNVWKVWPALHVPAP